VSALQPELALHLQHFLFDVRGGAGSNPSCGNFAISPKLLSGIHEHVKNIRRNGLRERGIVELAWTLFSLDVEKRARQGRSGEQPQSIA